MLLTNAKLSGPIQAFDLANSNTVNQLKFELEQEHFFTLRKIISDLIVEVAL